MNPAGFLPLQIPEDELGTLQSSDQPPARDGPAAVSRGNAVPSLREAKSSA
jgi:hypothetical protein